jgi:hypothetical protein
MVEEEEVTQRVVATGPPVAPYGAPVAPYAAPVAPYGAPVAADSVTTRTVRRSPSSAEFAKRIVIFVFALIQALILLRLVLLLINASRNNGIVDFIYSTSSWFVGPFEGIVRTDAVQRGASVLDVTAIVALIGWTILELIIVAGINIARREP